jgi:hypothetical protein
MTAIDYALHRLWVKIRRPFIIPQSICAHVDGWEIYDMHLAGCKHCGVMHLCTHDTCPKTVNDEGHSICNITGLCTKMLNFSNLEYIDTVRPISHHLGHHASIVVQRPLRLSRKKRFKNLALHRPKKNAGVCKDHEKIDDMINLFVRDVFCSDQWKTSNDIEHKRYASKCTSSFTKVLFDL